MKRDVDEITNIMYNDNVRQRKRVVKSAYDNERQ